MGLESRVVTAFPLGDQEFMCRHLNKVVYDWVDDYKRKQRGGMTGWPMRCSPPSSPISSPSSADWCLDSEPERYAKRLASTMDEMQAFYDAVFPRAEEAIAYLEKFPLDELPEDAQRLLNLLYSLILVSFPVEIWRQPYSRTPARPPST